MSGPSTVAITVSGGVLLGFVRELMVASNIAAEDARVVAEGLLWADLRGRHSQGASRLPVLLKRVKRGLITTPSNLAWTGLATSVLSLDANNAFGHIAGRAGMERAIEMARTHGIGVVTVRRSNHFGAAGYYVSLAAERECVGIACSNAFPKVAPYGGIRPVFGTNPVAFGCPTSAGVPVLVDFSTSAIAGSSARSLSNSRLPEGVAVDENGRPTTDPDDLSSGALLPAAGPKGSGLALMVDVLCGILSGAATGREVGSMYSTWDRPVNAGHAFVAIDIRAFLPVDQFLQRLEEMLAWVKTSGRVGDRVLFPGEIRGEIVGKYEREGIPLPEETVLALAEIAKELHMKCPWD